MSADQIVSMNFIWIKTLKIFPKFLSEGVISEPLEKHDISIHEVTV